MVQLIDGHAEHLKIWHFDPHHEVKPHLNRYSTKSCRIDTTLTVFFNCTFLQVLQMSTFHKTLQSLYYSVVLNELD